MKNKNIFEKNAKIPDIVQQKANAAFATIYNRQDEPDEKPQKTHKPARATIIKIASTVVAAAITITVLSVALAYFGGKGPELPEGSTNGSTKVSVVGNEYRFAIKVCLPHHFRHSMCPVCLLLHRPFRLRSLHGRKPSCPKQLLEGRYFPFQRYLPQHWKCALR